MGNSQIKIRRKNSDSVNSVDKEKFININFNSTNNSLINNGVYDTLNLNELFYAERSKSNLYRIILTIKPYCSNVLFNPCTEIMLEEGSGNVIRITKNGQNLNRESEVINRIQGKTKDVTLYDMIRNSEYSTEAIGYEYHPGLDFFNNHILRNKSYRVVNYNRSVNISDEKKYIFNTIEDFERTKDGEEVKRCCRLDINDTDQKEKHLYNVDDVLRYDNKEAINTNLKDSDGWFGFYNTSTIEAKDGKNEPMDISRAINNKGNCEFVDMYPDRTLFSFSPKYNRYKNRLEYNWDIFFTYPFESCVDYTYKEKETRTNIRTGNTEEIEVVKTKDFEVVQDGDCNGLYIVDAQYKRSASGSKMMIFRTLTKHNLKKNDYIHILYNENEKCCLWNRIDKKFKIHEIGDINGDNKDYYFQIKDSELLDYLLITPKKNERYSSWDYVKDIFYSEILPSEIGVYSSEKKYKKNELVKEIQNNEIGGVYVCIEDTIENTNIDNKRFFINLTDFVKKYASSGLTQIPQADDMYIGVKTSNGDFKYYTLYNHDLGWCFYDYAKILDSDDFIMGIINNVFRDDDGAIVNETNHINSNTKWHDYISFRMRKVVGDIECKYYVRKFKKIKEEGYDNETYKLAYSNTIYGDEISQVTFTEALNLDGLVDNMGRQISEIYATIIKNNKGYKWWYLKDFAQKNFYKDEVEFSHCFGPITSGFNFYGEKNDRKEITDKRKNLGDVRFMYNNPTEVNTGSNNEQHKLKLENSLNEYEIMEGDDWFYGDIVEFSPSEYKETTICDVGYRFNTAQREYGFGDRSREDFEFKFDDIDQDDYEGEFKVKQYVKSFEECYCKEGYFYKPHYRLKIKDFGNVNQATHNVLFIDKCEQILNKPNSFKITTKIKHNLNVGDKIIVYDKASNKEHYTYVSGVNGLMEFITNITITDVNEVNIPIKIEDKSIILKSINHNIPHYATKILSGTYLWRDVINLWENDETKAEGYPFANNAHYIDTDINFYLKRQNFDNSIEELEAPLFKDIYVDGLKSDDNSIYDYKEETEYRC